MRKLINKCKRNDEIRKFGNSHENNPGKICQWMLKLTGANSRNNRRFT